MQLVTYNIRYCCGRDDRFDAGRIIDTVCDADIIALQEVERFWTRSRDMDQARVIADALPRFYWMFGPTIDVLKSDAAMGSAVDNRRRQFGNMVLSRFPILSSRNHLLPKYTDPTRFTIQRGVLETTIATPHGPIRVLSTHLCHLSAPHRLRQVETILGLHARAQADGAVHSGEVPEAWGDEQVSPVPPPRSAVLMGDFNMQPQSAEYARLLAGLGPSESAGEEPLPFVDAWVQAGGAPERGATLYSDPAARAGIRIDYCFVTRDLAPRIASAEVDEAADGSDHQPVRVRLALP
jgi:endonuclease/exonuclease/phosphatase family metal-dependent hydrolase